MTKNGLKVKRFLNKNPIKKIPDILEPLPFRPVKGMTSISGALFQNIWNEVPVYLELSPDILELSPDILECWFQIINLTSFIDQHGENIKEGTCDTYQGSPTIKKMVLEKEKMFAFISIFVHFFQVYKFYQNSKRNPN